MTVHDLFNTCGNLSYSSFFRVISSHQNEYATLFRGRWHDMCEEIRERKVVGFDFDNDLNGVLVVVY